MTARVPPSTTLTAGATMSAMATLSAGATLTARGLPAEPRTPGKAKGKTNQGDLAGHSETKGSRTTAEFSSPAESTAKSLTSWSAGQKKEIVTMQRGPVDAVIETPDWLCRKKKSDEWVG